MRASRRSSVNRPDLRPSASVGASSFVAPRRSGRGRGRSREHSTRAGDRSCLPHSVRAMFSMLCVKQALRNTALRECGHRCVYCATSLSPGTVTLDHVMPRAHGGTHDPGNLVAACMACNRLKSDCLPWEFFARHPWAGENFLRHARTVHRALKRGARRAVSLAFAREAESLAA